MQTSIQTASFKTLGCRLNQAEMDALARRLQDCGVHILPFGREVDLTVVNTCTVTSDADRDSRYAIRQAIRRSPRGRVVVTGCYAQMSPAAVKAIDGVDLVLDNREKMNLLEHLKFQVPDIHASGIEASSSESKTRSTLKVQDGCDYHCTFCIIPFARGRAQSPPFPDVVREAEGLVARGFREIVLTGVNIGTYCSEENGKPRRLVDLIGRLQEIDGLARLRISSIEPNTVTDALLKLMSRSDTICPHLHIPIQSASDPILAAMRRKYRRARLEALMEKIRTAIPDAGIGTDVIAGFPGETDALFEETLRFVESAGFSYLHAFPYSARAGTAASKLADAVPTDVIHRRVNLLRELSLELHARFARRFAGRTLPVLFECPEGEIQTGLTGNYLRVQFPSSHSLRGHVRDVTLEASYDHQTLSGQIT